MTEKDKSEKEVKSTYSTKGRKYTVQHVITVQIKVFLLHALSTMLLTFNTVMKVCVSASGHLSSHGGSSASQRRRKAGTPSAPSVVAEALEAGYVQRGLSLQSTGCPVHTTESKRVSSSRTFVHQSVKTVLVSSKD